MRKALVLIMTAVIIVGLANLVQAPTTSDWPMFRHDLNHTGYSTSTAPNTNQIAWSYTTGDIIFSSPAVAGGMVYVGSYDAKVYCLDAATGAFVWSYTTGWIVWSSPAVAGGMVYVGSIDHNVYCLDAATGAFVWSYTTGNAVYSSPAVVGGMVYVGSTDHNVYCLDAATGAFVWSYTTGDGVASSPAVAGGMVYVGSFDGKVYCLDAATGAFVWSYTTGGVWPSPVVAGGMVYVGSDKVYCLDAATGAFVWSYTTGSSVFSSPAVAGGMVYVGMGNNVYCLDAATGAFVWSYTTGNAVSSSPAVAGGMVYVGSRDDKVYCLDAATGALVWSYITGNFVDSSPAVAGGMVYVGSYDRKVYAFGPTMLQLTVASVYDSPSPTSGVFTYGTSITASVTSPVAGPAGTQYVCTGWTGTGDVPASGTGTTLTFTITQNSTITWNWKTQYQHTITSSPGTGSGYVTVDGVAQATPYTTPWWDSGSSHTIAANSPVTIVSGQSQYIYSSWSDSGAQSHSVSPTAVTTYTANFQLQYYFGVSSAYDSPTGEGWYNSGSSVSSAVTRPVSGGTGVQYETTGWTGSGSLSSGGSAGSSPTGSFTITAYSTCTWNWKTQYYLTVKTIPTGAAAIAGQGWYDALGPATLSAPPVLGIYHFWGWDVDGTMQGNTTLINVQMNGPHTATAHYDLTVGGKLAPIDAVQLVTPWIAVAFLAALASVVAALLLLKKRW